MSGEREEPAVKPIDRLRHHSRLWGAALVAVIVAGAGVVALSERSRGPAHRVATVAGRGRSLGPLAHGRIQFAFDLRLNEGRLNSYLRHVTPGAGSGHGLSAAQFGARFGVSDQSLSRLRGILRRLGIVVAHVYPQRTAMLVTTSVDRMQRLFMLHFSRYQLPGGQRYFAPDGAPQVPGALTPYVTGLGDLSDRPVPAGDIPGKGLTPSTIAAAYDVSPLYADGIRGQGQTIAVATAEGAINPADLQVFAQQAHIPTPQVEIKPVDGGSTFSGQVGSDTEVDTDLEIVAGVAPDAHILDYQGPDGSHGQTLSLGHSLADIYNTIEQDGQAKIVSTSYGECEGFLAHENPGDQALMDNSLKALEASNATVFVATGDTGAYACLQAAQIQPASTLPSGFTSLGVQTPASSPYDVSVGGTRLELRANGSYLTESAWGDPLRRDGAGGGFSGSEPRPAWQQGPGVSEPTRDPHGLRGIPDVSGPADPTSGFLLCQTNPGASSPTCGAGNGGTSAAAPFWAASMLLVQQYAESHHAGALARCFAAPILYDLARTHQPVPPFHQVTLGNNGYYPASAGWNPATGLGSPDVFNLAQDYANFLRNRSSHSCPF